MCSRFHFYLHNQKKKKIKISTRKELILTAIKALANSTQIKTLVKNYMEKSNGSYRSRRSSKKGSLRRIKTIDITNMQHFLFIDTIQSGSSILSDITSATQSKMSRDGNRFAFSSLNTIFSYARGSKSEYDDYIDSLHCPPYTLIK
jgi:hypothetical protein